MAYLLLAGGALLLYLSSRPGNPISTVLSGAVHGSVKLGNADPNFGPWLQEELDKLIGPATNAAAFTQASRDYLEKAIRGRRLWEYTAPGAPGGSASSPFSIGVQAGQGANLALAGTQIGLSIANTAVKAIPIIGDAISFATSVLGIFGAQHAAAVQREQTTLKSVEPRINQALDQIDQAYKLGQLSAAQVRTYLEELYTQFVTALAAISQPTAFDAAATIASHHCNAGCTQERQLRGIIDAMETFDY